MFKVASFDISTNAGVCLGTVNGQDVKIDYLQTWTEKKQERPIDRAREFAERTLYFLDHNKPDLIIIEGYATGARNMSTAIIECSAMIKFALSVRGYDWIEIPPTTLKTFVANNGTVKKDVIIKQVYKLWDVDTDDDNQADAVSLMYMGASLLGVDCVPEAHLRAWNKIKDHADYIRVLGNLAKKQGC
ncbi:ribonuclease H-like domain protein [Vibrio phage vB_ValS_PJ32]|nr:ribonuclease H-like domain protein [Vibrio phage vB_ValS_PJ32]